jgi:hypothetical protein
MQDLLERVSVNLVCLHRNRRLYGHKAEFTQVREEDSDHAKRKFDVGSDIYHRRWYLRELQHRKVLGAETGRVRDPGLGREHRGDQVEGCTRVPGTASSQSIRPDNRAGFRIEPPFVVRRHERLSPSGL